MHILLHFGDICNMTCSYCANEDRAHSSNSYMSKQVMYAVTKFVNSFDNTIVTLQGGDITVYPYAHELINMLNCANVNIQTNGLLSDKLAVLVDACNDVNVNITIHHDHWRAHKQAYIDALLTDYQLLRAAKNATFYFKLLVDLEHMDTTMEIADWLLTNVDNAYINVYHVRHTNTREEFLRTYIAAKRSLPTHICENLLYNGQLVVKNPFYDKPCKQFAHFMLIHQDGSVWSSFCAQAVCAGKLDESQLTSIHVHDVICKQRVMSCPEPCMWCNGFDEPSDFCKSNI